MIDVGHLPRPSVTRGGLAPAARERRRQIADDLYDALVSGGYSFWEHIHPLFLSRDITRHDIRELVRPRLCERRTGTTGRCCELFGMPARTTSGSTTS